MEYEKGGFVFSSITTNDRTSICSRRFSDRKLSLGVSISVQQKSITIQYYSNLEKYDRWPLGSGRWDTAIAYGTRLQTVSVVWMFRYYTSSLLKSAFIMIVYSAAVENLHFNGLFDDRATVQPSCCKLQEDLLLNNAITITINGQMSFKSSACKHLRA